MVPSINCSNCAFGRWRGLALAVDGLHLTGALGLYTGLITRIRELVWIAIGILLIKVGNKDLKQIQAEYEEEQKRKQKTE